MLRATSGKQSWFPLYRLSNKAILLKATLLKATLLKAILLKAILLKAILNQVILNQAILNQVILNRDIHHRHILLSSRECIHNSSMVSSNKRVHPLKKAALQPCVVAAYWRLASELVSNIGKVEAIWV